MSREWGIALAGLAMMLALGFGYQIASETDWYSKRTRLLFKGGATLVAALLAFVAYCWTGQNAALVMSVGILLCALADVVLEIHFLSGTALFAAGHLAYITSFWMRSAPGRASWILFGVLAALATLAALWARRKSPRLSVLPFFAYSLVISLMVSLALGQPFPAFPGAVLFMASDAIIGRRLALPDRNPWDRACIALYYSAQYLLAVSQL